MRALVYQQAEGLALTSAHALPEPVEGEALIRVLLAGVCNTDLEIIQGYMGFEGIPGHEFVGVVEEIYGEETRKRYSSLLGQRVVGEINAACHRIDCPACGRQMPTQCPQRTTLGILGRAGVFADYTRLPVENLLIVPEEVSNEEAVFVEPLAANFQILEQIHVHPTDRVLVLGDGKMGQLAAQVLALSSCDLLLVGKHREKLDLAARRGIATHRLEQSEEFVRAEQRRADIVVECTGSEEGLALALQLVRPRGTIALKSTVAASSNLHLAPIVIDEIRVQGSRCGPFAPALRALRQQQIDVKPLISARYPLEESLTAFERAAQKGTLKVLIQSS